MLRFIIDDQMVTAHPGDTLLDVARAHDIFVPALCYHKAVSPYGACRLCLVEVKKGERTRIVASCSYQAADGLRVNTQAPAALQARNIAMELLVARCQGNPAIQALAAKMGVTQSRFAASQEDCILCGLCVRVCTELIGASAISFVGRGARRAVGAPYGKPSQQCTGCGACVAVCPTGALHENCEGPVTVLPELETVLQRSKCTACNTYFAAYRHIDQVQSKTREQSELLRLCPDCRRKRFSQQAAWQTEP